MSPSTSSNTNKDIVRHNKANSVVIATKYSQICQYGLESIITECEHISKNDDIVQNSCIFGPVHLLKNKHIFIFLI